MVMLVKPNLTCNLGCKYCYEAHFREVCKPKMEYDIEAILRTMEREAAQGGHFSMHGGEPLMMPKYDVESILAKSKELMGLSSVQTNGTMIDDDYLRMFKEYNTSVGISCDGIDELNEARNNPVYPYGGIMGLIERLKKESIQVSIMGVISKANAGTPERLQKFMDWLLDLKEYDLGGRMNPCYPSPEWGLPMLQLIEVFNTLAHFYLENGMRWSPMRDIALRVKRENAVCIFMGCDPFHTSSALVILGDGSVTNCMRTNYNGVLLRHPAKYPTRQDILKRIPQEYNGCMGCEYWEICGGGCPSMGIDGDWRNRDSLCELYKSLFKLYSGVFKSVGGYGDGGHKDSPHQDHHTDTTEKPRTGWVHTDTGNKPKSRTGWRHTDC